MDKLALEIAKQYPISDKDAHDLLEGIAKGKAGGTEASYIMALEGRDKVIHKLSEQLEFSEQKRSEVMRSSGLEYIVFILEEHEHASELNSIFRDLTTDVFKVQAFSKGQMMHGLNHKGKRPTIVVDLIEDTTLRGSTEEFDRWYTHCVEPTASRAEMIGK